MEGEPIVGAADSAPAAETATGETGSADTQTDATHGGETTEANPPTDDATAAPTDDAEEGDDPETRPSDDDSEEVAQTKAQKRRERQKAREEKRVADAVAAEITRREAERAEADRVAAAEAKAKADAEAYQKRFGELVGTPERRAALDAEIEALTEEVGKLKPYADGTDLDALEAKQTALSEKVAERKRLNEGKRLYDEIDQFQFEQTQQQFLAAGTDLPASHQQQLAASTTVPQALKAIRDGGIALGEARASVVKDKEIADWKGKYEKAEAALTAMRTGGAGDGPAPNGTNGSGGGTHIYTRAELREMQSTPDGMARYRANKAEIERQAIAGLIH